MTGNSRINRRVSCKFLHFSVNLQETRLFIRGFSSHTVDARLRFGSFDRKISTGSWYGWITVVLKHAEWFPRKSAGQTLFSTIAAHGSLLAKQTWQAVLWQVLFPLLDKVRVPRWKIIFKSIIQCDSFMAVLMSLLMLGVCGVGSGQYGKVWWQSPYTPQ